MKFIRKLFGVLLISTVANALQAQDTECTVRKSFPSGDGTFLCIYNKFGDINIITAGNDSISACATITINQEDKELSQKSISLIKINIEKSNDTINIQTVFDDRFFSTFYRKGRSGFSVDYTIYVPASTNLFIKNSFGDVAIDEIKGIVNVKLSQGDFSASRLSRGNVKPVSTLYFEHGKADIREANWLSVTAKHCQSVEIGEAKALLITSEFSKLSFDEVSSLICDSKSDYYKISSIKNLISESSYTEFEIEELSGQFQASTSYGSISVAEIKNGFTLIDLSCTHSPVELSTQKGISYKTDITVTGTLLDFPFDDNPGISRLRKDNTITLTGVAGKNKDTKSLIKIKADFGTLEIQ
jgi:hypothetical protein